VKAAAASIASAAVTGKAPVKAPVAAPVPRQPEPEPEPEPEPVRPVETEPYVAVYDYEAADTDECSVKEGDVVINVTIVDDGWVTVRPCSLAVLF
jgi:hypothetical protein